MSKVKSKSVKDTKSSDPLSKVKGGAIVKPAKSDKAKSKDVAKQVALKENKKSKKVKEPTPEPSTEEESGDSSSESESSESESESEVETKKPVTNGKKVKPASDSESSDDSEGDSEGDSDDSDESDVAVELPKANGAKLAAKSDASSDESDDSDDSEVDAKVAAAESSDGSSGESESEDERPAKKAAAKKIEKPAKAEAKDDDESDSADEDSEDSDDSAASEEEKEVKSQPTKRKAAEEEAPAAKKTKTDVDTSRGANLFVGNLSWNVDEAWLQEEFAGFGEISAVRLMTDRATGRSKGFGYVEFVDAEDAAKAHAAKQGAELDGRALNVDFANAKPSQSQAQDNRRKSYGDQTSQPSETLFVGNLSFNVGQEAVSEAFAPHGTILGVRLPTDRETGEPKGFGYVTFASTEEAQVALEAMQGFYLENRPIRLDYSAPRPANGDSPARGGRGGGRGFGGRGGDRGGFGGRGGRGGGRGDFRGGRGGPRGGRGGSTNRGGFGDFSGRKTTF